MKNINSNTIIEEGIKPLIGRALQSINTMQNVNGADFEQSQDIAIAALEKALENLKKLKK
ncbi:MAG: hypothetical protein VX028_03345 [Nanoarchaeota archaeon]|nr:hypothetical protein [Nanoarchaeota archaeon]